VSCQKGKDNATDYFLAGHNLGWWVIGASIFASNIGSEHIVGRLVPAPRTAEDRAKTRASWEAGEIAASAFILACIFGAYLYFTG
jgi:uncharacterized sodium:solute symporter family permease YidK